MSKDIYTDSTGSTEVTENRSPVAAEEPRDEFKGLFIMATEDEESSRAFPLSDCQLFIALKSIFYKDAGGKIQEYDDEKLLRSKDRKESLNRLLHSVDQAGRLLKEAKVSGAGIVYHPGEEDEERFHLSFVQAAVVVARLGIRPKKNSAINDTALDVIYGPDWEPRFDPDPARKPSGSLLTAKKIKEQMDKTIIGQDEAKETLAAALFEQDLTDLYNERHKNDKGFVPLKRKNILLYGPSGTGKTALIKKVSEILDKPVVIFDASRLTPSGYEGSSSVDILQELLTKAGGSIEKASRGIVYLDECDKCFLGASGDDHLGRFKGSAVFELLRMMDGCEVSTPLGTISTDQIQFILGGAFPHLDDIVRARTTGVKDTGGSSIGFLAEKAPVREAEEGSLPDATVEDLKTYGVPTELLGRIAVICRLKKLTKENLVQILSDSDLSPLRQYRQKLSMVNVTLEMSPAAMETVAELALERKLGARGLEYYLRKALNPVLYTIGGNRKRLKLELKPECFTRGAAPALLQAPKKQRSKKA